MMKHILFICHGNICRSPIAEYVFKDMTQGKELLIESMAVSAEELGNPIYPPAAAVLRRRGIPFGNHRARRITKADYDRFDLILMMEEYNRSRLMQIIGSDPEGKVCRLMDLTDTPCDIEDPWFSGNFDRVFDQIQEGCQALLKRIEEE